MRFFVMGNVQSSEERDGGRRPLMPIENRETFRMGVATTVTRSTRQRRQSTRRPTRKRTRASPLGELRQPAGCLNNVGPVGERWPIDGISPDVHSSRGHIDIEHTGGGVAVVYWHVDVGMYKAAKEGRERLPRLISSAPFAVETVGTRLLWKLTLAPKDCRDDSVSLYLESLNGCRGEPFPIESHVILSVGRFDNVLQAQGLAHCFSSEEPVWGVQNIATFSEILESVEQNRQHLCIGLRFCWVRDGYLFPPQFLTLHAENPELYQVSEIPKIFLMEHFLSFNECEELIEIATPRLYRSRVSTGTETPSRTSSSMFFTGNLRRLDIVKTVEEKLMRWVERPEIHKGRCIVPNESLQAVRYNLGEFYAEHYDIRAGQADLRAATLIVYLRDTAAGGATYFPRASESLPDAEFLPQSSNKKRNSDDGLRIYPRQGRAILFWSRLANGMEDKDSLHSAEPIILGEKWIATRWLREIDDQE